MMNTILLALFMIMHVVIISLLFIVVVPLLLIGQIIYGIQALYYEKKVKTTLINLWYNTRKDYNDNTK